MLGAIMICVVATPTFEVQVVRVGVAISLRTRPIVTVCVNGSIAIGVQSSIDCCEIVADMIQLVYRW